MLSLESDIRYIKGIGERRAKLLGKLGIHTLRDLISYFPRDYEDRTVIKPISDLLDGETVCVRAMVASPVKHTMVRKGLELSKVRVVDGSSEMELTFFNQSYVKESLRIGETYQFHGKTEVKFSKRSMVNPVFEREDSAGVSTGRIVPIYRLTTGLSGNLLSKAVAQGLAACSDILPDLLPDCLRQRHQLAHARFSYENIHFPASFEALTLARRRLIFEELFVLSVGLRLFRSYREQQIGLKFHPAEMDAFYRKLPFSLTGAQQRVIMESISDMTSGLPMNRLIQGDVGSGKTMAAAACVYFSAQNGYQSALMAPTEILAQQHFQTLLPVLEACGLRLGLLTGSLGTKTKRETLLRLASGEIDLLIGTHALLSEDVEFAKLGLVITDEQHRFGVNQRAAFCAKGEHPHVLVMSATPIPRTLALIIYGDLDVSVIDELPPGRQTVDTFAVEEGMRPRIDRFIRRLVGEGRQVLIVCPLIEEGEQPPNERKSVTQYADRLQTQVFPELRVSYVHGRMKSCEKEKVMVAFSAGESDILVSTTVIEVGVDLPNAVLMVVENAERFGLSQLHQLRGRVGRGTHKSYCVLFSASQTEETKARLSIMQRTNDGFMISEEDLKIRGPGDFFGSRQHGLPDLKIADFACDMQLLRQAQEDAAALIFEDSNLSNPEHNALLERVRLLFKANADTFN